MSISRFSICKTFCLVLCKSLSENNFLIVWKTASVYLFKKLLVNFMKLQTYVILSCVSKDMERTMFRYIFYNYFHNNEMFYYWFRTMAFYGFFFSTYRNITVVQRIECSFSTVCGIL